MNTLHDTSLSDDGKLQKIQSLRDMITNAEKTIQGAKSVLLQLEGKKRLSGLEWLRGFTHISFRCE